LEAFLDDVFTNMVSPSITIIENTPDFEKKSDSEIVPPTTMTKKQIVEV
jgi:hypothetical protein